MITNSRGLIIKTNNLVSLIIHSVSLKKYLFYNLLQMKASHYELTRVDAILEQNRSSRRKKATVKNA